MAQARLEAEWNRTAHVLAVLINVNRDPKRSRAVIPQELNPYTQQKERMKKPDFYITAGEFAKKITMQD